MAATNGVNGHSKPKKESYVDVLIVGPGPAGLMAALWFSRFDLNVRIVDKRGTKVYNGQADGLQSRTLEIFDSFDIVEETLKHASNFTDFCTWTSGDDGGLQRDSVSHNTFSALSRYDLRALNQGYIERIMLDSIKEYSKLEVERGVLPSKLEFDKSKAKDFDAYPITVELQHLSEEEQQPFQASAHVLNKDGSKSSDGLFRSNIGGDDTDQLIINAAKDGDYTETVHAKFMIGSEGAHSWTRRQLGFEMEGDSTDYVWGVLDVIPVTDFPDIRKGCTVQSKEGSMLIIPREHGVVRLYTQLLEVKPDETGVADREQITPDKILNTCKKIMKPYSMDYTYCDWWTAYQIGQRICNHYTESDRIFLAGDAVHTHSPKGGQGMNVSMGDTYNLCWKIAGVLTNHLDPSVLSTYSQERSDVAHALIAMDRKLASTFSGQPTKEELMNIYRQNALFMAGTGYQYPESNLTIAPTSETDKLSSNMVPGMRFPTSRSSTVIAQCDKSPFDLQKVMTSDGRFRVVVLPGDISQPSVKKRLDELAKPLLALTRRYMYAPADNPLVSVGSGHKNTKPRSLIDVLTVHKAEDFFKIDLVKDFGPPYVMFDEDFGYDYYKVFADYETDYFGGGKAYDAYGVDPKVGCMVAVRPDQMVGWIGTLEDVEGLSRYFAGFLKETPMDKVAAKKA